MEFVSLSALVEDLLLIARGSKLSSSEKISKRQIESWIHQYRAMLIRNEISSGDTINPDYVQSIPSLEIVQVDAAGNISNIETGDIIFRTKIQLPRTVNLRKMSGITYVGTLNKKRIQLIPGHRAEFQLFKRFTSSKELAYLEDRYLYIVNPKGIRYITIRGIFEDPTEVWETYDSTMDKTNFSMDNDKYPIPINMLPALKQLILERELGIEAVAPGDLTNDSRHNPDR